MPLGKEATDSFHRVTGITATLSKRLPVDMFNKMATYSLENLDNPYAIVTNGAQVADIVPSTNRQAIPVERVLTTIEKAGGDGVEYHRAMSLSGNSVQIEAIGIQEQPVHKGDLVRAGVMVRFNVLGAGQAVVQSYCQRLACTNGAVSSDVVREFGFGDGDGNIWNWFKKSMRDGFGSLGNIVNRWRQMSEEHISPEDRNLVLESLLKRAGIRGADADVVRANALSRPPENAYDMMQLVTWASTHHLTNPRAIMRAQQAAAVFSDETEHQRVCPTCHKQR